MEHLKNQKRVLLVNPPFPRLALRGAPLSQLYLAGSLREPLVDFRGECKILDLNIADNPEKELEEAISEFKPTHAGITRYSPNAKGAIDLLRLIKQQAPHTITMSGGPHEVFCGQNTARNFGPGGEGIADVVVPDFDGIRGFHRALGIDSNATIFDVVPAHDLLPDHPKYQFEGLFEGRMTQLMTSVGCPYTCAFCHHDRYQPMPVKNVIEAVEHLLSLGFRAIVFDDLNFVTDKKRTLELADAFAKLNFEWGCQTRADGVSEHLLEAMKQAGCTYICYGLETGDDNALASPELKKRMTLDKIRTAARLSQQLGIRVGLYVMFGHLAEMQNPNVAHSTLDAIEELRPQFLSISFYAVYPSLAVSQKLIDGYEEGRYSQEQRWLRWDEGWGAYHPHCNLAYAEGIGAEIQKRAQKNPETWNGIRRF